MCALKLFKCQNCGQILYFENGVCTKCSHSLGYDPALGRLLALERAPNPQADANPQNIWQAVGTPAVAYRFCSNASFGVCNWLIDAVSESPFCLCCRHNATVPDTSLPTNLEHWRKMEIAKHRLFYSLIRLKLPLGPAAGEAERLMFDFLAFPKDPTAQHVMTGHDNGLITIALAEADDAEREKNRVAMHEPYRTLLGHFRHEVGHYYWDRLVRDNETNLTEYRALFGDERLDYAQALATHYANGAPPDWQSRFVSTYATSHPWEDFAETWAHYLHIVDTLEVAGAFSMSVHPRLVRSADLDATVDFDAYVATDIDTLIDTWMPLSLALNSLNRAMGEPDLYPFVLSKPAIEKMGFIHSLVHPQIQAAPAPQPLVQTATTG
jgi:hypothetical protein